MTVTLRNQYWATLADEHRQWLVSFDHRYLANWERILKSDIESALCEAGIRRLLQECEVRVEPNEDLTGAEQRPDFLCFANGERFYVEATHISEERATTITGLIGDEPQMLRNPTPLNRAIFYACIKKATQCGDQDAPVLLAIGTTHAKAAMLSFIPPWPEMILTGRTTMTVELDKESLRPIGGIQRDSELHMAAFLKFEPSGEMVFARSSISGLLLCGLSFKPMLRIGLLHPNPAHSFNPIALPDIPFQKVQINELNGQLHISWHDLTRSN